MKAIVFNTYGSPEVLHLEDVAKPVPKDDEVLVRVHAASVNHGDFYMLSGKPFTVRLNPGGLRVPKYRILGGDVAGRVETIGPGVKHFQVGDEVVGDISNNGMGAFAEYVAIGEKLLAKKPAKVSFEDAAATPAAAVTAMQGLLDTGKIQPGQKVLINGSSGGVGTFAVQLAKSFGAEVSAVCSTGKIDLMGSIGADHVIDYTRKDFTADGKRYDLIVAVNGFHTLSDYRRALTQHGTYVCIGGTMRQLFASMIIGPLMSRKSGSQLKCMGSVRIIQDRLVAVMELLESGKISPVIDRRYPLSEVPDAFTYIGAGHAKGKVVINVV